jgi:FkbM family methyltransferase
MTRKFFLDCGGHDGCSVRKFRDVYPDAGEYFIHSFEPRPDFAACYDHLGVNFHAVAVWVVDGQVDFYLCDRPKKNGASLLGSKVGTDRRITVPCIDFSRWLRATCRPEDYVILKMDIEGAEYAVLSKLIDDGALAYIDKLLVEFHHHKIGMSLEEHEALLKRLEGVAIEKWNAQSKPEKWQKQARKKAG